MCVVIKTFPCKETEALFQRHRVLRFQTFERVALRKLEMLHAATDLRQLAAVPGNRLEPLKGDRQGEHIRTNDRWRVCFVWQGGDAHEVELTDHYNSEEARETDMTRRKRDIAPVHPGEILNEEFLKPIGMTMHQLSMALRVPANRIGQIIEGERGVSIDTAYRLGRYFGTGPEFWMNLQTHYDIEHAKDRLEEQIAREVQPRG
jgi:addiction module HigA family antidote